MSSAFSRWSGVGLHVDAIQPPEAVEVVDVAAAQRRRQGLEHLVDRHAQRACLFAVQIDPDLRVVRVEGGEHRAQLRPLPGGGEELLRLLAELRRSISEPLRSCSRKLKPDAAPKPDRVGMLKGKIDRLGNRRELRPQPAHDAVDVQRRGLALVPWLHAHEDRAVVRLVGAGHRAVAADGLVGVEPVGLGQDVLDLLQHQAGALQRRPGWQAGR